MGNKETRPEQPLPVPKAHRLPPVGLQDSFHEVLQYPMYRNPLRDKPNYQDQYEGQLPIVHVAQNIKPVKAVKPRFSHSSVRSKPTNKLDLHDAILRASAPVLKRTDTEPIESIIMNGNDENSGKENQASQAEHPSEKEDSSRKRSGDETTESLPKKRSKLSVQAHSSKKVHRSRFNEFTCKYISTFRLRQREREKRRMRQANQTVTEDREMTEASINGQSVALEPTYGKSTSPETPVVKPETPEKNRSPTSSVAVGTEDLPQPIERTSSSKRSASFLKQPLKLNVLRDTSISNKSLTGLPSGVITRHNDTLSRSFNALESPSNRRRLAKLRARLNDLTESSVSTVGPVSSSASVSAPATLLTPSKTRTVPAPAVYTAVTSFLTKPTEPKLALASSLLKSPLASVTGLGFSHGSAPAFNLSSAFPSSTPSVSAAPIIITTTSSDVSAVTKSAPSSQATFSIGSQKLSDVIATGSNAAFQLSASAGQDQALKGSFGSAAQATATTAAAVVTQSCLSAPSDGEKTTASTGISSTISSVPLASVASSIPNFAATSAPIFGQTSTTPLLTSSKPETLPSTTTTTSASTGGFKFPTVFTQSPPSKLSEDAPPTVGVANSETTMTPFSGFASAQKLSSTSITTCAPSTVSSTVAFGNNSIMSETSSASSTAPGSILRTLANPEKTNNMQSMPGGQNLFQFPSGQKLPDGSKRVSFGNTETQFYVPGQKLSDSVAKPFTFGNAAKTTTTTSSTSAAKSGFDFGTSAKSALPVDLSKPLSKPSFGFPSSSTSKPTFGSSTTTASTTVASAKPVFGSNLGKAPSNTGTFSFGTASTVSGFASTTTTSSTTSGSSVPIFGFGTKPTEPTQSGFGQSVFPAANTSATASNVFGFGASTASPTTTTATTSSASIFSFGATATTSAPQTLTKSATFSFGSSGPVGLGFGQPQQQSTVSAAPMFGSQTTSAASGTSVSLFGHPAAASTTTAPSFGFGQQTTNTTTAGSVFSFGANSANQPATKSSGFAFGSTATQAQPPGAFNFGSPNTSFGAQKQPAAASGFNFNTKATQPSFNFGSPQSMESKPQEPTFNFMATPTGTKKPMTVAQRLRAQRQRRTKR